LINVENNNKYQKIIPTLVKNVILPHETTIILFNHKMAQRND